MLLAPHPAAVAALTAAAALEALATTREDNSTLALLIVPRDRDDAAAAFGRWANADLSGAPAAALQWPYGESIERTYARIVGGAESAEEDRALAGLLRVWAAAFMAALAGRAA